MVAVAVMGTPMNSLAMMASMTPGDLRGVRGGYGDDGLVVDGEPGVVHEPGGDEAEQGLDEDVTGGDWM